MYQPCQFRLLADEISAMQRDGTMHRDLEIAERMGAISPVRGVPRRVTHLRRRHPRRRPDGRARRLDRSLHRPISALPPPRPRRADGRRPCAVLVQLHPIPTGARLCRDCLLEHQLQLQLEATEHQVNWTETGSTNGRLEYQP